MIRWFFRFLFLIFFFFFTFFLKFVTNVFLKFVANTNLKTNHMWSKKKIWYFYNTYSIFIAFLISIFTFFDLKHAILSIFQTMLKRQKIVDRFNLKENDFWILLLSYVLIVMNFNLQHDCWHIHAFEMTHNLSILHQTIDRIYRLNNFNRWIYIFEYTIENTFDFKIMIQNFVKIIFQTMIELHRQIFHDKDDFIEFIDIEK